MLHDDGTGDGHFRGRLCHGFAVRDLKHRGLANLIIVRAPEENARALAACRIAAWYAPGLEILYTWRTAGQRGESAVASQREPFAPISRRPNPRLWSMLRGAVQL